MRRSATVTLTLLPVLASAAVAAADPPGITPTVDEQPQDPDPSRPFTAEDMEFMPPGLTPVLPDCEDDPYWEYRLDCTGVEETGTGVVRGGFGHYFWSGGGG